MVQTATSGTACGDTASPTKADGLKKAFMEYEDGDFLGDMVIKAVHVKDFKTFREMSIHDFKNDDWRAFKFMVKLYESYKHFIGLQQFIKPEGKK